MWMATIGLEVVEKLLEEEMLDGFLCCLLGESDVVEVVIFRLCSQLKMKKYLWLIVFWKALEMEALVDAMDVDSGSLQFLSLHFLLLAKKHSFFLVLPNDLNPRAFLMHLFAFGCAKWFAFKRCHQLLAQDVSTCSSSYNVDEIGALMMRRSKRRGLTRLPRPLRGRRRWFRAQRTQPLFNKLLDAIIKIRIRFHDMSIKTIFNRFVELGNGRGDVGNLGYFWQFEDWFLKVFGYGVRSQWVGEEEE
ncbi:hypothetical protein Tco_0965501 [Tanacetum coccineum]